MSTVDETDKREDLPGEELERDAREPREHYLPIRRTAVVKLLTADLPSGGPQEEFREFCRLLEAVVHDAARARLVQVKEAYLPFDPDGDTVPPPTLDPDVLETQATRVFDIFADLLQQANFRRLSPEEVDLAADAASDWGQNLHVDYSIFERLDVYARGDVLGQRTRHDWWNFFSATTQKVPTYQRLAVIFRVKSLAANDSVRQPIALKLFKNIPKADVDTLLPGTKVRMTLFDHGQIVLPTISGVALTLFKLVQGMLALASLTLFGALTLLGLIGGTIGYGVRSFYGYLRTKERYHHQLTQNLYFRNLDNNAGVLHRLVDEAEEQEFRELLLGWWLLWRAGPAGNTEEQIDRAAENWLEAELKVSADFECDDALESLRVLGLVEQTGGTWRAVPLPLACERLREMRLAVIRPLAPRATLGRPHFDADKVKPRRKRLT